MRSNCIFHPVGQKYSCYGILLAAEIRRLAVADKAA